MESTGLWSTPRRELRNPQISVLPEATESTGLTPTPTNAEPVENTSPHTTAKSPVTNLGAFPRSQLPFQTATPNFVVSTATNVPANGRPCLAGTQTIRHQTGFHTTTPSRTITDLLNASALSEYTHDSSGFGSLMTHDQSSGSNFSSFPRSADRSSSQFRWATQNLISLDGDTSDLGFDQSSMHVESGRSQSPIITRQEYVSLGATAVTKSVEHQPQQQQQQPRAHSPVTAGLGKMERTDDQTAFMFQDIGADGGQQTMSGRQSRMLEENLASVARYVEELTGCGTTTGGSGVSLRSTKLDVSQSTPAAAVTQTQSSIRSVVPLLTPDIQQMRKDASMEEIMSQAGSSTNAQRVPRPVSPTSQLTQLQQLQQQLSTLVSNTGAQKMNKNSEAEILNSAAQELLCRILANQLPSLIDNAAREAKPDSDEWSLGSGDLQAKTPLMKAHQQHQVSAHLTSGARGQAISCPDTNIGGGSVLKQTVSPLVGARTANSSLLNDGRSNQLLPTGSGGTTRPLVDTSSSSPATTLNLSTVDPTLLASVLTQLGLLESLQPSSASTAATPASNTAALLVNLLGGGQTCSSTATNQNSDTLTTAALATLLSSLQSARDQNAGPRPLLSRDSPPQSQRRNAVLNLAGIGQAGGTGLVNNLISPGAVPQPVGSLVNELQRLTGPYHQLLTSMEPDIERAANVYRNSASSVAQKSEAAYHWSGKLPVRVYRSMTFSRKVFLGGVPWDSTSEDLVMAFSRFGNVTVSWPQKDGNQYHQGHLKHPAPKGYCYLIFEHESSVAELLAACVRDPSNGGDYYRITGPEFKSKNVQVIPWVISDSQYTKSGPYRPDTKRTVFIGALHGMITAEALVTIMNDLFGNVVFAALDTDRYKYPIGSGRVAFSSHKSYMRAVTANFVDVRTSKFTKTIQIDPYLEDAYCDSCYTNPGIYFCRAFDCFRYFCPTCWQLWHNSAETLLTHKPLRRTFKPFADTHWTNPTKY